MIQLRNRPSLVLAFLPCIVLMLLHAGCRGKEHRELEPNDTIAQAHSLELGMTMRGYLATADDHDFYRVRLDRDTVLRIELSGIKGVNHALRLWRDRGDGDPVVVKEIDDSRKSSPEIMANIMGRRGTWIVEVTHGARDSRRGNQETPYDLTVTGREAVNEEEEPNDAPDQATTLRAGRSLAGYYSPARNPLNNNKDAQHREEDWYVYSPDRAGGTPPVIDITLTGVPGVNASITLYDEELNEIASADNGGPGEGELLKGLGLDAAKSKYYIMVASKNYSANHEVPYTLSLTEMQPDAGYEIEKNDSFEKANTLTAQSITGRFNTLADRDYYRFKADRQGAWYRVELRPPADADAVVTLYNGEQEQVAEVSGSGAGTRVVIPSLFMNGDIFIVVRARSIKTIPSADYFLSITPMTPAASMEKEPNNTTSQATPFTGRRIEGFLSSATDKDYYLIVTDNRQRRSFRITGIPTMDITVSLTDPLGYIIKTETVKRNQKAVITDFIDRKAYLIVASDGGDPDHPYIIEVTGGK